MRSRNRRFFVRHLFVGLCVGLWVWLVLPSMVHAGPAATGAEVPSAGSATLAEIESCASRNLPDTVGRVEFTVEAVDRSGSVTTSRAVMHWRKDEEDLAQVLLRISEPETTAGTAVLIVDRAAGEPEFYVRLPEVARARRVRSRRLRGPVLGTDFSYEDLDRMRKPIGRTQLELVGLDKVDGEPAWLLEAVPDADEGSEYTRVLTWVDPAHCLPLRIDLFEAGDRLRKRLDAPRDGFRPVGSGVLPHRFVMRDLRRETRTIVLVDHIDVTTEHPPSLFTKHALEQPRAAAKAP